MFSSKKLSSNLTVRYYENEAVNGLVLTTETDSILIESAEWEGLVKYVEELKEHYSNPKQLRLPFEGVEELDA